MEDAAIREKELQAKLEESVSRKGGARCLVLNAQPSTFLVQVKLNLEAAGLGNGPPEGGDPENPDDNEDGEPEDEDTRAARLAAQEAARAAEKAAIEAQRNADLEFIKEDSIAQFGIVGIAWEFTESDSKTRREGVYGKDKPFEIPAEWLEEKVEVIEGIL